MKALFEVGEEVILCSKTFPDLNGEAVVTKFVEGGAATFNCPHCNKNLSSTTLYRDAYYLSIPGKHEIYGCCAPWAESALRKKHRGGDFSFDELMKEMISGKKIQAYLKR